MMDSQTPHPDSSELTNVMQDGLHGGGASSRDDTDTELQRNISRIERLQVEERRDALPSPMATLLPELLSTIFVIYARDDFALANLRWTKLLFVCRHWYDVGMSTPELWSSIDLSDDRDRDGNVTRTLRRVLIQRTRAGKWPLTVKIGMLQGRESNKQATLISALWDPLTLYSLTVGSNRWYTEKVSEKLEAHPHTTLRHLTMRSHKQTNPSSIPDIVLGVHTPQLRHLSVDCMAFNFNSIQGLRSLHASFKQGFSITFELSDILDALVQCPLLEHLQLIMPGSFRPEAAPAARYAALSHLASVTLRGTDEFCSNMLRALRDLPCTTSIATSNLRKAWDANLSAPPSSLSYFKDHASRADAPAIRVLGLVREPRGFAAQLFQSGLTGDLEPRLCITGPQWGETGRPRARPYLCAVATFDTVSSQINALQTILQYWPISQVTHLDVRTSAPIDADVWRVLFATLPTVTTVMIRPESPAATTLFEVLDEHLRDRGGCVIESIMLDLTWTGAHTRTEVSTGPRAVMFVRGILGHALAYCAEAMRANVPLETMEVVNDKRNYLDSVDCNEFSKDLGRGFVYRGTLYSTARE
ncbi:unnamed protein product [Peniophora sp. CBMAI 1063]|nr:unnamed protein product [Peniophora sp. CBMAI 1063]